MYFCNRHDSSREDCKLARELSVFIGLRYSHEVIAAEHHFDWLHTHTKVHTVHTHTANDFINAAFCSSH